MAVINKYVTHKKKAGVVMSITKLIALAFLIMYCVYSSTSNSEGQKDEQYEVSIVNKYLRRYPNNIVMKILSFLTKPYLLMYLESNLIDADSKNKLSVRINVDLKMNEDVKIKIDIKKTPPEYLEICEFIADGGVPPIAFTRLLERRILKNDEKKKDAEELVEKIVENISSKVQMEKIIYQIVSQKLTKVFTIFNKRLKERKRPVKICICDNRIDVYSSMINDECLELCGDENIIAYGICVAARDKTSFYYASSNVLFLTDPSINRRLIRHAVKTDNIGLAFNSSTTSANVYVGLFILFNSDGFESTLSLRQSIDKLDEKFISALSDCQSIVGFDEEFISAPTRGQFKDGLAQKFNSALSHSQFSILFDRIPQFSSSSDSQIDPWAVMFGDPDPVLVSNYSQDINMKDLVKNQENLCTAIVNLVKCSINHGDRRVTALTVILLRSIEGFKMSWKTKIYMKILDHACDTGICDLYILVYSLMKALTDHTMKSGVIKQNQLPLIERMIDVLTDDHEMFWLNIYPKIRQLSESIQMEGLEVKNWPIRRVISQVMRLDIPFINYEAMIQFDVNIFIEESMKFWSKLSFGHVRILQLLFDSDCSIFDKISNFNHLLLRKTVSNRHLCIIFGYFIMRLDSGVSYSIIFNRIIPTFGNPILHTRYKDIKSKEMFDTFMTSVLPTVSDFYGRLWEAFSSLSGEERLNAQNHLTSGPVVGPVETVQPRNNDSDDSESEGSLSSSENEMSLPIDLLANGNDEADDSESVGPLSSSENEMSLPIDLSANDDDAEDDSGSEVPFSSSENDTGLSIYLTANGNDEVDDSGSDVPFSSSENDTGLSIYLTANGNDEVDDSGSDVSFLSIDLTANDDNVEDDSGSDVPFLSSEDRMNESMKLLENENDEAYESEVNELLLDNVGMNIEVQSVSDNDEADDFEVDGLHQSNHSINDADLAQNVNDAARIIDPPIPGLMCCLRSVFNKLTRQRTDRIVPIGEESTSGLSCCSSSFFKRMRGPKSNAIAPISF